MASGARHPDPRVVNLSIHDQLARRLGGTLTVGVSASSLCRDYGVAPNRAQRILQDFAEIKYPTRMVNDELCVFGKGGAEVYIKSARDSIRDAERLKRRRVMMPAGSLGRRQGRARWGSRNERNHAPKKQKHHSSDRRVALATKRLVELAAATAKSSASSALSQRAASPSALPLEPISGPPTLLEPTYFALLKSRKDNVIVPPSASDLPGIEGRMFDVEALPLVKNVIGRVSSLEALTLSHGLAHQSPLVQQTQLQHLSVDEIDTAAVSGATVAVGSCHSGPAADQLNRISAILGALRLWAAR